MQNHTAKQPIEILDNAINRMDRQGQFQYLLPLLPGHMQLDLMIRWQEAAEIADPEQRGMAQGAILVSMYGVASS